MIIANDQLKGFWLSFEIFDTSFFFDDFNIPPPNYYEVLSNKIKISYLLDGFFGTSTNQAYLNDVINRFLITVPKSKRVVYHHHNNDYIKADRAIKLNVLSQNLDSLKKLNVSNRNINYKDELFWQIKIHGESLISQIGDFSYHDLYSFAVSISDKERSTIKAKCRSIFNWYDERNFKIGRKRRKSEVSRSENAKLSAQIKADRAKKSVEDAISNLSFLKEKLSITNVAKYANVARDTAKKYMIELGVKK